MNRRRSPARVSLVVLALCGTAMCVTPAPATAQRAFAGLRLHSYRMLSDDAVQLRSVSLLALPWSVEVPVASWAGVQVDGAWARASASAPGGASATSQGLTDTDVRLAGQWRRFVLTVSATVPTGEATRSLEEATVIGLLSSDLLPVEITRWGSGGGVGADLAYAFRLGRASVGIGGGYTTSGDYEPLEGVTGPYAPGARIHARATLDTELGRASVLSLLIGFQRYEADTFDAADFMSAGDRFDARLSLAAALGARESVILYAALHHRSEGQIGTDAVGDVTPVAALLPGASVPMSRDLLVAGGEMRIDRDRLALLPAVETRLLRNAQGVGQGWLTSVAGRAEYRLRGARYGRALVVAPELALRLGKVLPEADVESMMIGWEAGVTARWVLGR